MNNEQLKELREKLKQAYRDLGYAQALMNNAKKKSEYYEKQIEKLEKEAED